MNWIDLGSVSVAIAAILATNSLVNAAALVLPPIGVWIIFTIGAVVASLYILSTFD